jgi:microcystin-dependent protein
MEIIILIFLIIFIQSLFIIYLIYKTRNSEKFSSPTLTNEIKAAIDDKYKIDMDAMRNLAQISKDILTKGDALTLPAEVTNAKTLALTGDLYVSGKVIFGSRMDKVMNIIPHGFIMAYYKGDDPLGWGLCDGQKYILDSNNVAIVSALGVKTPDLRSRFIIGSSGTAENQPIVNNYENLTSRPFGGWGGVENVTLTNDHMPSHSHYINWDNYPCEGTNCGIVDYNRYWSNSPAIESNQGGYKAILGNPINLPHDTDANGGGQPHDNMPPYFSLKYYMKL